MRIIAGRLGGRDLGAAPKGVRPTSDRVRESLFSVLGSVEDLVVLDLFAGTGAFGLEAYSRGASRVVFVDLSRRVVGTLRRRIAGLGLDETPDFEILTSDAKRAIRRLAKNQAGPFDLVFLDPPYAEGDRDGTLSLLFESNVLSERARVVVEGPKRHALLPQPGARIVDQRDYGDTTLTWFEPA